MNWKGGKQKRECKMCKILFLVYPGNKTQKSCSRKCAYQDKERLKKALDTRKLLNNLFPSQETKLKISCAQKGKKVSEATRQKLRKSTIQRNLSGGRVNQYGCYKGGNKNKLFLNLKRLTLKRKSVGTHSFEDWNSLKIKYGNSCLSCRKGESEVALTQDHIIPLSKGGTDYISNIQPLCRSCNSRKMVSIIDYRQPTTV